MKIILILLSVMFVLFTSTISFSETEPTLIKSDLTEIGAELFHKKMELEQIWIKLITMEAEGRIVSHMSQELLDVLESVSSNIGDIRTLLEYETELIITIPHIMEKYKSFFSKLRIQKINHTKEQIKIRLGYLNYIYDESEFKGALGAVGDPRENLQATLELLDKSTKILQRIEDGK